MRKTILTALLFLLSLATYAQTKSELEILEMFNKINEVKGLPKLDLISNLSPDFQELINDIITAVKSDDEQTIQEFFDFGIRYMVIVGSGVDGIDSETLYHLMSIGIIKINDKKKGKVYIKDFYTDLNKRAILLVKIYE